MIEREKGGRLFTYPLSGDLDLDQGEAPERRSREVSDIVRHAANRVEGNPVDVARRRNLRVTLDPNDLNIGTVGGSQRHVRRDFQNRRVGVVHHDHRRGIGESRAVTVFLRVLGAGKRLGEAAQASAMGFAEPSRIEAIHPVPLDEEPIRRADRRDPGERLDISRLAATGDTLHDDDLCHDQPPRETLTETSQPVNH